MLCPHLTSKNPYYLLLLLLTLPVNGFITTIIPQISILHAQFKVPYNMSLHLVGDFWGWGFLGVGFWFFVFYIIYMIYIN